MLKFAISFFLMVPFLSVFGIWTQVSDKTEAEIRSNEVGSSSLHSEILGKFIYSFDGLLPSHPSANEGLLPIVAFFDGKMLTKLVRIFKINIMEVSESYSLTCK